MPSNITRGATFTAVICIISALHSTTALSAEPQNNSWLNPFGCANKDALRTIGETSYAAQNMMDGASKKRAQRWADRLFVKGTPYSREAVPYLLSGAKSPRSRIAARFVTAFSFGWWAYDTYVVCQK